MERYRVEHIHWIEGSGVSYSTIIDWISSFDGETAQCYEDFCENNGDWIVVIDNITEECVSEWRKL